ncbi:RNA polymerase sigma factor [Actinomadura gamaensis]|uniref:Sigma-70 family RNA polymerase sigma factor n=1 Tax=Actinomadura gamaensis TaxID=1763541 RepID=A0ABV9U864_9ACTN
MKLTFSTGAGTDDPTGRHVRVRRRDRAEAWPAEPLWPAPDPSRDREILLALASGRDGAEARLYDAYAARLHDYASCVLREGLAADVVHDVLVDAARRAVRVRDRERLGAWLYGATRARIRRRTFPRPHWDWTIAAGDARPPVPFQARDALDHLMAVTGPTERELLLLTGRHGLTCDDLEAVLGRPARQLRRRCALAWRRAADIIATHLAASAPSGALGPRPLTPLKVQGSTPPNGLPYTAPQPSGQDVSVTPPAGLPYRSFASVPMDASRDAPFFMGEGEGGQAFGVSESGARPTASNGLILFGGVPPELRVEALLVAPVPPPPPQRLRMRVLHTLADPALAPYRAEISARGGRLTPEGLPRQPDVTSPIVRRTRRATLRTTLTGAAAVTGARTSAAATATVGTALVPLFLVPVSTPTVGPGLTSGGHGGHSVAIRLSDDVPQALAAKPAPGPGPVADVQPPAVEPSTALLARPDERTVPPPINETPKYPEFPAISGGVPSGPVLPVHPPTLPAAPRHLVQDVPQVVREVPGAIRGLPQVVQDVPRVVQDVPRVVQDVPRVVQDVPRVVQDVPKVVQDVPRTVQDVPNVVRDVPDVVQDVPGAVSGLTGTLTSGSQN